MELKARITGCIDCQSIRELYKKLQCSLLNLGKNRLGNDFYGVDNYFSLADSIHIAHYVRILKRRIYGYKYLGDISNQDIISQALKLVYGECPFCVDCEQPTTTTTSTTDTTTTNPSSSTTMTSTGTLTTSFSGSSTTTTTTTATFTLLAATLATIQCAEQGSYTGGQVFPSVQEVVLGTDTGTVDFDFQAFNIPDKFLVIFDDQVVIDTGYRGNSSYQTQLNTALASRGLPPETIQGVGLGTSSFVKSTATTSAFVYIYAPLSGTQWNYTLSCPS